MYLIALLSARRPFWRPHRYVEPAGRFSTSSHAEPRRRSALVVARRRREHDPPQLGDGRAAEPQRRDEALQAEAAGVERRAQLAERGAVLVGDRVLAGL